MYKSCLNCKWSKGPYCERPSGSSCNWVGEMFRGEENDWIHWEPKNRVVITEPARKTQPKLSDLLRQVAELLEGKIP